MLDADRWLEDRLRIALREEAASIPFTLTVADLERRRAERARPRVLPRRVLPAWAAAIGLVLLGIAGFLVLSGRLQGVVPPAPTPSATVTPPPSPATGLPSTAQLLEGEPPVMLRLEGRHDPTTSAASQPPDDRYLVGQVTMSSLWRFAAACTGPDRVVVEIGALQGVGTYVRSDIECDGEIHVQPSSERAVAGQALDVVVIAPEDAAWAIVVGEYDESFASPPDLPTPSAETGWRRLTSSPPLLVTPDGGSGARLVAPAGASEVAARIVCEGTATLRATLGSTERTVHCSERGTGTLRTPVTPGEDVSLRLETDGLVWVSWLLQADEIAAAYPSAPPLPPDVAAATWADTGSGYLTVGTVGGSTPTLVELPQHQAAEARGDLVVAATADGAGRMALELISIPDGAVVGRLVEVTAFLPQAWLDIRHGLAIYALHGPVATEFRAVTLDGEDDRRLLRIPASVDGDERVAVSAELDRDDRWLVVEVCRASGTCTRSLVDPADGTVREVDTSERPICTIDAVIDGTILGRSTPGCAGDGVPVTVAAPVDGGPALELEAAAGQGGVAVRTDSGLRLVVALEPGADGQRIVAIDVESGEAETIHEVGPTDPFLGPIAVRLPDGYVLLATSLSEDPAQTFFPRAVPVLVDLDTGERTELPNLPHGAGGELGP